LEPSYPKLPSKYPDLHQNLSIVQPNYPEFPSPSSKHYAQ
jgi:hypothetical protein